jgi:8-oxo-dGTP pyrophosphatase MutT (NUDIX family)
VIEDAIVAAIAARLARALARPRGDTVALRVDGLTAGRIDTARAARLALFGNVFSQEHGSLVFAPGLDDEPRRSAALEGVTRALAAEGALTAWRDEHYAAAPEFGAPPWFLLERAAARYFGIHTYAVHVNGLVRRADGIAMWIARRSATKAIDPGLLDNLVGGGIAAGESIASTLIRESSEEAGIGEPLARDAFAAGAVHIFRAQPDGIQHETIFVHDLWLPEQFVPTAVDGEVAATALMPLIDIARIAASASGPDAATADAALVIADCLLRHGAIPSSTPAGRTLDSLRHLPAAMGSAHQE